MYQKISSLFMICETPLHAGSGDSLGVVDMPIQRERHTSYPKIEASSLKGALRAFFNQQGKDVRVTFGAEDGAEKAAALGFSDARLLLFPIKSLRGTFAWVTCPRVLKQFVRDMKRLQENFDLGKIPENPKENECVLLSTDSNLKIGDKIILEEYTFSTTTHGETKLNTWVAKNLFTDDYWKEKAIKDIVILNDDDFKDFVNLSTEVITRTKISEKTGTVVRGGLFTEEYLPTESVLYSLVLASPEFSEGKSREAVETKKKTAEENMAFFTENISDKIFQLGGNSTLGKGILRTTVLSTPSNK